MKKKLLVLLIAIIPTLMPNLATAIAIDLSIMTDGLCFGSTSATNCQTKLLVDLEELTDF